MVWLKWACRSILKSGLGVMIRSSKDDVLGSVSYARGKKRPLLRTRVDVCHKRGEAVRRQKVLYTNEGRLASENRMTRDLLLLTLRREWYDRG